ncbi:MAG: hypothetical protein K6F34_00760, partial [Lachnospiraceae bacterium]|nr:hypothetical protein [Lachnospiraceae bacterium]
MKKSNNILRRSLAMGLAVVLLAGAVPANVYAEDITDPEMPVVISEGMEEDEVSSSAETEVISDEVVVSEDTEDELTAEEAVSDPDEVFLEEEELSSYDAVQSVSPDGNLLSGSGGAYSDLIPTDTDNAEALTAKQVGFGSFDWYIIEDNSTSATEGTLTLFAAEFIGNSIKGLEYLSIFDKDDDNHTKTNKFSASYIKSLLDGYTSIGGYMYQEHNAINTITVKTKGYNSDEIYDTANAKLYLLDVATANNLPLNVRKCSAKT